MRASVIAMREITVSFINFSTLWGDAAQPRHNRIIPGNPHFFNKLIKTLDDGKQVFFRDYGHLMLQDDGSISPDIMPDFLHPAEPGYQIWAEAMMPTLREWLEEDRPQ